MGKWRIEKKGQKYESHNYIGDVLRYSIHRHISYAPGQLLLSCHDIFGSRYIKLESEDFEDAKSESLTLIKIRLTAFLKDLPTS